MDKKTIENFIIKKKFSLPEDVNRLGRLKFFCFTKKNLSNQLMDKGRGTSRHTLRITKNMLKQNPNTIIIFYLRGSYLIEKDTLFKLMITSKYNIIAVKSLYL